MRGFLLYFLGLTPYLYPFTQKGYIDRISIYNKIIFLFFSLILIQQAA